MRGLGRGETPGREAGREMQGVGGDVGSAPPGGKGSKQPSRCQASAQCHSPKREKFPLFSEHEGNSLGHYSVSLLNIKSLKYSHSIIQP